MKNKDKKSNKNLNKKDDNNNDNKDTKLRRVSIEFSVTKFYFIQLEAPTDEKAIDIGWSILNGRVKEFKPEQFLIGNGFSNKILKTEEVDVKNENNNTKRSKLELIKPS